MFDEYNHTVSYEKQNGKDKYNNFTYDAPVNIKVRIVDNSDSFSMSGTKEDTAFKHKYHVPFAIVEGDKIDGLIVDRVRASTDIHGRVHFYIVGVV